MSEGPNPKTSVSLLDRLRLAPTDDGAWTEFVERYGPLLYDWCQQWHLQDADARDVTQAVLIRLVRRFQTFRYNPSLSFRKWLWTVARHAWFDFLADRKKEEREGRVGAELLDQVATREDLFARLDAEFDRELLEEANARVRLRVEPRTWEAFRLTAVEELSGLEAGNRVGMSVAAVFKAKSKVLKMLREELARLEGRDLTPGDGDQ